MDRTQLSAVVLDLLEKETGETYETLEESTTLAEGLGLDSLDMAGLVLHIESHFGIQIETELLDKIKTVGQMLDTLEEKLTAKEAAKKAA
ncbi:MAG: acyl carrier protein [Planctomycetia bacterium]|jgi:acyl carrier protein|nr:acyl carrier protein [Planctomycetia bacterium]NDH93875.1 acyl carrier protein [Planctomycetia bacterium]